MEMLRQRFKMENNMRKRKLRSGQEGVTIVEVLLSALIGMAICVAGLYVLNAKVLSVESSRVTKEAENAGEESLSALSATASVLTVGGSFTAVNDNVLSLSPCTSQTCDYVLQPDIPSASRTSPAKGFPYGSATPTGYAVAFLRRWRVEDENTSYRLRKITIAVLRDENDTKPSLIAQTTITVNYP